MSATSVLWYLNGFTHGHLLIGYVATDSGFTLTAYSWAFAYLVTITTEMVYIEHMVTNLGLNTWGFVLYNNFLSLVIPPVFCITGPVLRYIGSCIKIKIRALCNRATCTPSGPAMWIITGEYSDVFTTVTLNYGDWFDLVAFLAVSFVFGLLISFFRIAARKAISATAFMVTGVVNKFLIVAINVLIWKKHAGPFGLFCLIVMIAGGVLYQQSVSGVGNVSSPQ